MISLTDEPIKPDPDRKPKRPRDPNQRAKFIVDLATGEAKDESPEPKQGSAGGKVGGRARAKSLSVTRRREIAKKAAAARWKD